MCNVFKMLFPIFTFFYFQNVVLSENSEQFERFVNIPQPLTMKIYIFNVTNVDAIQNGAIPQVEEIGPYIYKYHVFWVVFFRCFN